MKCFVMFFSLLFINACQLQAQQNAQTYLAVVNTDATHLIDLKLEGDVELDYWSKDQIRVEITVKCQKGRQHIVRHLMSKDRFKVVLKEEGGFLTVTMPNLRKQVKVNGYRFEEELFINVTIPYGLVAVR